MSTVDMPEMGAEIIRPAGVAEADQLVLDYEQSAPTNAAVTTANINIFPTEEEVEERYGRIVFWMDVVPEGVDELKILSKRKYSSTIGKLFLTETISNEYHGVFYEAASGNNVKLNEPEPLAANIRGSVDLDVMLSVFNVDEIIMNDDPESETAHMEYEKIVAFLADKIEEISKVDNSDDEFQGIAYASADNSFADEIVQDAFDRVFLLESKYDERSVNKDSTFENRLAVIGYGKYAQLIRTRHTIVLDDGSEINNAHLYGVAIN